MHLFSDTEFGKAVKKLFERLNQMALVEDAGYEDGCFKAYIFGGAAIHIYTNSRTSRDVDVEFAQYLPSFRDEDVVVTFMDEGTPRSITFDDKFSSTFAPLHEDYHEDAIPFFAEQGNPLWVYLVSPLDLAVSKLGRFAGHDLADIEALARQGLIDAASLRKRAEFALVAYVGDTDKTRSNIEQAVRAVEAIGG